MIVPVTQRLTESMNALRSPSSGSYHSPAYTRNAQWRSRSGLKLFWWIVPTSFSSSLCAVRRISAAGTS